MPAPTKQLSSQVTDLVRRVDNALDVYHTYGKDIVKRIDQDFSGTLPKEEIQAIGKLLQAGAFSAEPVLRMLAGWLKVQLERLEASDMLVLRENREDKMADTEMFEVGNATRQGTLRLKRMLGGIYGDQFLMQLGLNGETPEDRRVLLRQLKTAQELLNGLPSFPDPIDEDGPFWTKAHLEKRLEKLYKPLEGIGTKVGREKKETQEARLQRVTELTRTRVLLNTLNSALEGFARLAERKDVAQRVRPSGGRPSKGSAEGQPENPSAAATTTPDSSETPTSATP